MINVLRDTRVENLGPKPGISLSSDPYEFAKGSVDANDTSILILGIDPGEVNVGVCLFDPTNKRILSFQNFDLNQHTLDPSPQQGNALSCYKGDRAVATNLGQCVITMIRRNPRLFTPFESEIAEREEHVRKCIVVIEKQCNLSTNNCCVLAAIQSFYTAKISCSSRSCLQYECHILDPSKLNKHFPKTFIGTKGNKPLRKGRILADGKKIVGLLEMKEALAYRTSQIEPTRDTMKRDVTIHALDAMFYVFAICIMHTEIEDNPYEDRLRKNSQLRWIINNRLKNEEKKQKPKPKSKRKAKGKRSGIPRGKRSKKRRVDDSYDNDSYDNDSDDNYIDYVTAIDLTTPPGSPQI